VIPPPPSDSGDDRKIITITPVQSIDPNQKVGPQGISLAGYLTAAKPLTYSVYFANQPNATAPTQTATITDTLNTAVIDPTLLTLGPISFVDKVATPPAIPLSELGNYSADVDLRPTNNLIVHIAASFDTTGRVLKWVFTSIDPATGQPPSDPLAGFLPPGEGGAVTFTVVPLNPITGTQITNKAAIVFDQNAPIDTPVWLNTIDDTSPTTKVNALPAIEPTASFTVSWAGTDAGSGVEDFSIYFSENGRPFALWLTNTAATSATFNGQSGHSYSFYSIARDLVGNIESGKTTGEALTRVVADTTPPVIIPQITGTLGDNRWYRSNVSVNWSVSDPESGIASLSGCTTTMLTTDTAGVTFTCLATDGAGLSSSVPVTIKIDKTPPVITASANPATLWPPNGKMVTVTVSGTIMDATSGVNPNSATFAVVDTYGTVQSSGNVVVSANGSYSFTIALEARRSGNDQNGRTFTLTVIAQDNAGNQSSAPTAVVVPHDQGN